MLLARKVVNAGDLLWGSLDERERMIVVYAIGWAAIVGMSIVARRSNERRRRQLGELICMELAADAGDR